MGLKRLFCFYCGSHSNVSNLRTCGNCESYNYCSKECQISDWNQHKLRCAAVLTPESIGKNPADRPKRVPSQKQQVKLILEQLEVKVRALDPLIALDLRNDVKNITSLQDALKRRNETHQNIYHEVVDSLSAIMDVYHTSAKQQSVVLGNIIAAQRLYEQLHTGGLTGEQMPIGILEEIHERQQQAWTILEIIIGVNPETEEEMHKREESISNALFYQTCSRAAFEMMESKTRYAPQTPTPMGASFFDFLRDTTMGATSQTLREMINCMGWGPTYYAGHLSDERVEEEHTRTKNAILNFSKMENPNVYFRNTHFIAKGLLHLAEYVESLSENTMLSEMSPKEKRRFYEEQTWMMRLAASASLCAAYGLYYVYGIKSKTDADADLDVLFAGRLNEVVFQNETAKMATMIYESKREEAEIISKEIDAMQSRIDQAVSTSMALKDDLLGSNAFMVQQLAGSQGEGTQEALAGIQMNRTRLVQDWIHGIHKAGIGPNSTGYLNLHSLDATVPSEIIGEPMRINTTDIAGRVRDLGLHFLHFCAKSLEERLAKNPDANIIAQENRESLLKMGRENLKNTRELFLQDLQRAEKSFDEMQVENYRVWAELLENLGRADLSIAIGASKALAVHYDQIRKDTELLLGKIENPGLDTLRFNYTQIRGQLEPLDKSRLVTITNAATIWGNYQEYIRQENSTEKREANRNKYPDDPFIGPLTGDFVWILKNTLRLLFWQPWATRFAGSHFAGAEVAWVSLRSMTSKFGENMMSSVNFANFASSLFTMVMICNWFATVAILLGLPVVLLFLKWFLTRSNSTQNTDSGGILRNGRRNAHVYSEGSAMHAGAISSLLIDTKKTWEHLRMGFGMISTVVIGISATLLILSDLVLIFLALCGMAGSLKVPTSLAGILGFGEVILTSGYDLLWAVGTFIMHGLMVVPLIRTRIPHIWLDKISCLATLVHYGNLGVMVWNIQLSESFMSWLQWFMGLSVVSYWITGYNLPIALGKGAIRVLSFVYWLGTAGRSERVRLIEAVSKPTRSRSRSRQRGK